ncbi:Furostanol glycoside 26-O-beta-glucosidase, partial [Mucuna pruriens]
TSPRAVVRASFPRDFLFGVGSSALQIEGSATEGGRGPSVWDAIVEHDNGHMIKDSDKYFTMIEHYKRYKEDVAALKQLGINSYRFSISWSRILPGGTLVAGVNQEGVDFYNSLINELVANGITPFVTILHFDYPLPFLHTGGFLNSTMVYVRNISNHFKDYSEFLFKTYGDRVKHWTTINEPEITAVFNYMHGNDNFNPEPCQITKECKEAYRVLHNFILCHATAVKLYRENFQATQGGEIGIVISVENYIPYSLSPEDVAAAERMMDFLTGWSVQFTYTKPKNLVLLHFFDFSYAYVTQFCLLLLFNKHRVLDPVILGDYPDSIKEQVKDRLPFFTEEEKTLVQGSTDFVGINYYRSFFARHQPNKSAIVGFDNFDSLAVREGDFFLELHSNHCCIHYKRKIQYDHFTKLILLIPTVLQYSTQKENNWETSTKTYVYPEGLYNVLIFLKNKYQNPKIYITENGIASGVIKNPLKDKHRKDYIAAHINSTKHAIDAGVRVQGYFVWSAFDTFEFHHGFSDKWGLIYIDFDDNLNRVEKQSARWYRWFLTGKN